MATQTTAKIPFNRIVKIGMWSNTAKEALSTVYTKLQKAYPNKLVYIQNAGFFGMANFIPCWGLKVDGKVLSGDWKSTSYIAMKDNQIKFCAAGTAFPDGYTDGVSGYPALIENGKKSPRYHNGPDGSSDRGRTMLGWNNSYLILSCIGDITGSSDFTMAETLSYMLNQGCEYAVNLDGGGSSQCNYNGSKVTASRKVNNFIYVIVNPETSTSNKKSYTDLKVGDEIKITAGAKYTTGKTIPNWILNSTLYVRTVYTSGIVVFSTHKTGAISGAVDAKWIVGYGNESSNNYKVINCSVLNIRSEASTSGKNKTIVGKLNNGDIVSIDSIANGWGKLSDGRGYVYMTYLTKV